MSRRFEPTLSSKLYSDKPGVTEKNMSTVKFPVLGSFKYDGWRLFEYSGRPHTRSLMHPKNYHTVRSLSTLYEAVDNKFKIRGLDGEAIAGPIDSPNAMQASTSAFGSYHGMPEFTYLIFDSYQHSQERYVDRLERLQVLDSFLQDVFPWAWIVEQKLLHNWLEVFAFEAEALALGFEGVMLRSPDGVYKMGRSTFRDGILTALKRFEDDEAQIQEVIEQVANLNPAETDNYGRMKRSSHQENLVGKGTMGAVRCRSSRFTESFTIGYGPGLNDALRKWLWEHRLEIPGEWLKYKFQNTGVVDRPRHGKWISLRDRRDMPR